MERQQVRQALDLADREEIKASNGKKEGDHEGNPSSPPVSVGFRELFRFADRLDYILMAIGTVGALVHGSTLPFLQRVQADVLNSFGSNQKHTDKMMHEVSKFALYYIAAGAVTIASSWAEISCWIWTGERQAAKMRIKYLEAALNQDINFYDTEMQSSDVIYAINNDAIMVQDAISEKLGNFIHCLAVFISGMTVSFTSIWQLALVTVAVCPVMFSIGGISTVLVANYSVKIRESLKQAGSIAEETIVQIRTIFAYVGESKALQAYSAALRMAKRISYKAACIKGLALGIGTFVQYCAYALLFWYGGYSVRHHLGNGGLALASTSAIMLSLQGSISSLSSISEFSNAKVAAAKIFHIIDHKPDTDRDNDLGWELSSVKGTVELKNVNFSYPSRPHIQILNNLSLAIPAGKAVALIGSSGSGKSTVVTLIERFYDPTSGQVLLDGHDIKTLKLRWLRQQIGLVSQEPALFSMSIKENILLGRPEANFVEVKEVARVANAHSFIVKLPDGYDTQVGERGLQLSGGQRQRIAIARAMLKNPSIVLLDEATSALDSESEKLVQEALDRFMLGRTTLVIAHRLSTIRKADLVVVLQQGSVVEIGRHDDLIGMGADKSIYAKLIKMQEVTNEMALTTNTRKSTSARSSSVKNSFSSPIVASISSHGRSPIINLNSSYNVHSPYSTRLSNFSSSPGAEENNIGVQEQAAAGNSSFWRLVKMTSPEWPYALIALIGSIICGTLTAIFTYIFSAVISVFYHPNHAYMKREIVKFCYILVGMSFGALLMNIIQQLFWDVVGEKLRKRVKEKMLSAVLKNEMAWFDKEENQSGRLSSVLTIHADNVKTAIGDRISLIMQNFSLLLISFTISLVLQWRLALVLFAVFPASVAANLLQKSITKGFSGEMETANAKSTQLAGEAVSNIRTIAAFNLESKIVSLFSSNLKTPLRRCFWKAQITGVFFGISQFCLYASYALGLWYSSWLVKHGMSDFSKTIRVYMIVMLSAIAVADTLFLTPDLVKGGHAIRSAFEILDRKTEIETDDRNATIIIAGQLQGEIEFRHVVFSYPTRPDVTIFQDLSFRACAGKIFALVGPSGCGKSTVIALIERFYKPSSGCIMIDGKDIRKYNLKSLRQRIALVQQEPLLFATSIYENIAYGHESATEAEILEAATLANAHKFISSLPDGYKTFVGERGVQLSGGQKQRIAIARAILRKADIILLDEATSALDSESERSIQEALDRVCAGKTTIVVAHRLGTIRNAHVIAVINEGKIVEQGSDSQLLKNRDGIYARMVQLQLSTNSQAINTASGSSSTHPIEHQEE